MISDKPLRIRRRRPVGACGMRESALDELLLNAAPSTPPDTLAVECDAGQLKRWIAQLPVTSVVETVAQLHAAIGSRNQCIVPEAEQLKLLEVYRQAFDEILFTYDEFRLKLLPLTTKARTQLAADIMGLYLALAGGYRSVAFAAQKQGRNSAVDTVLLLAAYRAMELMVLGLIYARRMSLVVPPGTWLELHRLYSLAERQQATEIKVKAARRECAVPTIDRLYKQLWLLHVADTQGLNGSEWLELYMLLEAFAPSCRLVPGTASENQKTVYQIDLMADAPAAPFEAGRTLQHPRVLDISPAITAMNGWLAERQAKPKLCDGHEARLLAMHMEHLGADQGRKQPRVIFGRSTRVALGLSTLGYFLQDKAHLLKACEAEVRLGGRVRRGADTDSPELCNWTLVDQSEIGCQLLGRKMRQGEVPLLGNLLGVVGFESGPDRPILSVGMVRWIKEDAKDKRLQRLGVEIMEGEVRPIVFALTAKALSSAPQAALYIPKDPEAGNAASLVLPREVVAATNRLHVTVRGKSCEVILHSVVRESPLFVQCRFVLAREK